MSVVCSLSTASGLEIILPHSKPVQIQGLLWLVCNKLLFLFPLFYLGIQFNISFGEWEGGEKLHTYIYVCVAGVGSGLRVLGSWPAHLGALLLLE